MGDLAHRPLWNMLQLGAPRPRGRAPLSSTRQVGLAGTEVPSPRPFQRSRGDQEVSDLSLGLAPSFRLSRR